MANKNFDDLGNAAEAIIADFNIKIEKSKMINFLSDLKMERIEVPNLKTENGMVLFACNDHPLIGVYTVTNGNTTNKYTIDKESSMDSKVTRVESFHKAASIIEQAYNFEDWRCDGTVQKILEMLEVDKPEYVMANDLEKVTLKRVEFINSYKGIKVEVSCNACASTLIIGPSRAEDRAEEHTDDGYRAPFKSFMTGLRAKATLNKLRSATSPAEAFNILTEWLAEDQDHEGKFSYKDMVVIYAFKYNKHQRSIQTSITIGNKVKCEGCGDSHDMEVIFSLTANLTQSNIDKFYGSVKSFTQNFLD